MPFYLVAGFSENDLKWESLLEKGNLSRDYESKDTATRGEHQGGIEKLSA